VPKKIKLFQIIAGLLIINFAGFFLRYFELDTYFILLGFRYHFSLLFSILLILSYIDFKSVKEMFFSPLKQKFIGFILFLLFPLLFIPLDIFILNKFDLADQDYFFELVLSSIVDFPVYLVWNTLQFFMLFIFLKTIITLPKYIFIKASLLVILLFFYEIIPLENYFDYSSYNYRSAIHLVIGGLLAGLFFSGLKNIYLFTLSLFTILWINVLIFGSSTKAVVNILLASQYSSWEGIIKLTKGLSIFIQPAHLFLVLIISIFLFRKNKNKSIA